MMFETRFASPGALLANAAAMGRQMALAAATEPNKQNAAAPAVAEPAPAAAEPAEEEVAAEIVDQTVENEAEPQEEAAVAAAGEPSPAPAPAAAVPALISSRAVYAKHRAHAARQAGRGTALHTGQRPAPDARQQRPPAPNKPTSAPAAPVLNGAEINARYRAESARRAARA